MKMRKSVTPIVSMGEDTQHCCTKEGPWTGAGPQALCCRPTSENIQNLKVKCLEILQQTELAMTTKQTISRFVWLERL